MKTIVFFLEEPSAKEMLAGVLPRMLPENIHLEGNLSRSFNVLLSGIRNLVEI